MKKFTQFKFGIFLLFIFSMNQNMNAQSFTGVDNVSHDISYLRDSRVSKPQIKVIYGRPQKKEQKVFGDVVAFNEIWRTGANEATEIKFYQDTYLGNIKVRAGTYVLYTIPGEESWEIILSSNLDVLGAFQYDSVFDVARITVKPSKAEELEFFSIAFRKKANQVEMILGWDTTRVKVPLSFDINEEYAKL